LSPYDYWQFWRNIDDRDVLKFLKIFTDIKIDEIEKIKDDNINELKILLANKATEMLHGEQEAKNSEGTAKQTFTDNSMGDNLPSFSISEKDLKDKITIIDLIILSKLESSKSEIRRLIKGSGVKINNKLITDEKLIVTKSLFQNNLIKLSLGKKRHIKVELN
jgi:tyrosyl-tRNA synthetase